ncbi:unnamed protein product [Discula destructiva]
MSGPPNQNSGNTMNGGDGTSRKRQYPFKGRGGGGARGRGNRRGGPRAISTASPASPSVGASVFATSAASTVPPPPAATAASVPQGGALSASNADTSADSFSTLARYNISKTLLNTIINNMGLSIMTTVQAETLPHTLTGHDVLAQAKTGTGKTLAFLIPAIQTLINDRARAALPPRDRPVSLLVISPTRELASQIADEAKRLLTHFPEYTVQVAFGGTNPKSGLNNTLKKCDILVATPGRLLDYLGQPDGALVAKMQGVQTLVLDEADRLMDMGFLPDIQKVVRYLPPQASTKRTGMLFSATINARVKQFASLVLSDDYKFVSTIPVGEAQTHEHVPQKLIAVPNFADLAPAVLGALRHEIAAVGKATFKTIIFAPTAAQVDFYAHVLAEFRKDLPPVVALHSRISQSKRTSTTEQFRKAQSGILVATDVVARGLDFPGVTNVFQVGLPSEKEAYIHRLGRTARAGAEGRGCLILANTEPQFAKKTLSMIKFVDTQPDLSSAPDVRRVVTAMSPDMQAKTYRAWIGYYKGHIKLLGWTTHDLVQYANDYALKGLGSQNIPTVETRFVGKTGLKGVPGLNIVKTQPR